MASEWKAAQLREVAITRNGAGIKQSFFRATGVPLARVSDFSDRSIDMSACIRVDADHAKHWKSHLLREGDAIVATVGSWPPNWSSVVGKTVRVSRSAAGAIQNQNTCCVLARPSLSDQRFLFYLLRTEEFAHYAANSAGGSANQARLPVAQLERFEFLLPPLSEQRTIADVLGALDDKIELNRRMNATMEAMARALFQSWFVDFDPVRAKLDGRKLFGLDDATAALFPEHLDESEDGKLPVGWRQVAVESICAINSWTLSKSDDLQTLEYVEISEVNRGDIANIATYARGAEPSRARRRLRHGDTVLSTVRPDRGSYFLALNPPKHRVASTGFAVLTPTKAPWSFVHAAMTQPDVSDYLGQMADGGAYPAVRPEVIGAMKVVVPSDPKILEAFHLTCARLYEQAAANRAQSSTLAALRDTLLPKLLSGELRVA
ncbi:MAG: restriction endonuclease subunit S [Acidobacteria bacterium]|nr:restriction endonuclease subunit S [Acidobacteriota bacterium]